MTSQRVMDARKALERIRDFPYVGVKAHAEIIQIANQGLAALSGHCDCQTKEPKCL